jgi:hypothetical protein
VSRRPALAAAAVAGALVLSSCGGGGGASTPASSGAPPTTSAPASTVASTIDPNFDFGQTVLITPTGFRPRWLVSLVGKTITWRNESSVTASVVFDHESVRSGPIPPGGTYTYDPSTALSITYHSGVNPHLHGSVQVTPGDSS